MKIGIVCCPEPSATIRGSFLYRCRHRGALGLSKYAVSSSYAYVLHHGSVKPITESAISSGQTTPIQSSSCTTIVSLNLIQSFWEMEIEEFGQTEKINCPLFVDDETGEYPDSDSESTKAIFCMGC